MWNQRLACETALEFDLLGDIRGLSLGESLAMAIEVQGVAPLVQVFDMPRSIRFYRDLLGFALTGNSKAKSSDPDDVNWAMLQLSNATIMLNTAYDPDDVPEAPDAGALVRAPGHMPLLRLS